MYFLKIHCVKRDILIKLSHNFKEAKMTEYNPQSKRTLFFAWAGEHKGMLLAFILTLFWVASCVDYIIVSQWWQTWISLSFVEFIGACSGFFLPVILFMLAGSFIDRGFTFKKETAAIQSYLNELVYPTPEGPDYTAELTHALKKQIQEFKSVFESVNEQTTRVREDLKQWVTDLSTVIAHVDTQTITSIKTIAEHIHNLTHITETANKQTQQVSEMFSEQAVILQRVTKQTSDTITQLVEVLSHSIEAVGRNKNEVTQVTEQINQIVVLLENNIQLLSEQSGKMADLVSTYEESAQHQNAKLFGNLEKVLSVFKAHDTLLEEEVNKTTDKLNVLQEGLQQSASQVLHMSEKSMGQMNTTGAFFEKQIQMLQDKTQAVQFQIETMSKRLEKDITLVDQKLMKSFSDKETTDCLKEASSISAILQKASIDMAVLFPPKLQETLWEKYYNGDKAVFMRHITKMIPGRRIKKVLSLYQSNKEFKEAVLHYMAEFEKMTKIAGQNQDSNLLVSILIGSDMGRLYMILADMFKKDFENAH